MKITNTSISMISNKNLSMNDQTKTDKPAPIYGGFLNEQNDPIAQKKLQAQKKAMKVVSDAFQRELKVDDELKQRQMRIKEMRTSISKSTNEIVRIEEERLALRDKYGLTADSQEELDLKLLEKEQDSKKLGSNITLSDEEQEQLLAIKENGLTDYQNHSLSLYASISPYERDIKEATTVIMEDAGMITAVKLARLKLDPMLGATKAADAIKEQASKEIFGMLIKEGIEHIKEEQEEQAKEAEKKAEENEKLEKIKENSTKEEAATSEQSLTKNSLNLMKLDQLNDDVQKEVQDILQKMKLLEEDLKGAAVNQNV